MKRKAHYFTKLLDVPLSHASLSYYAKSFLQDRERVLKLLTHPFAIEREISTLELSRKVVFEGCIAIVLVDKMILNKVQQKDGYVGHYVLVFAFRERNFEYLDPDSDGDPRRVTMEHMNNARIAEGTDMDVIII